MDFLRRTREGYDAAADDFATLFEHLLETRPIERAMLAAFTDLVAATGNRAVADVGCGTGVTTAILRDLGALPIGIDLSPNMIAHARARHPDLGFAVGSMTDLDLADRSVGGVCAWYSTIHVPDPHLPKAFSEFHRVLVAGGVALLAFQVGDVPRHLKEGFGKQLDLVFYRRSPDDIGLALSVAGLAVYARTVREAEDDGIESTPQAFVIARKARVAG